MTFEDFESDVDVNDIPETEERGNRTFFIVAGILGGLMLLALACVAVYLLVFVPRRQEAQQTQVAEIDLQHTEVALAAEQTAQALSLILTVTNTPTVVLDTPTPRPTATPLVTPTRVLAVSAEEATLTAEARTATVVALLTQAAVPQASPTSTPSTLPQTGFIEDAGLPITLGLVLLLIAVILLSRRLRTTI